MAFPSEAFFASVYQYPDPREPTDPNYDENNPFNIDNPNRVPTITNFPLPSQSFFIGIPYIIGFVIAETPSNAAEALYFYDRPLYDSINEVPGAIDLLRTYNLPQGVSKKIGLYGTDLSKDTTFQKTDNSFPTSSKDPPVTNPIIKAVMMFTSHGYFQYGVQLYYFSTLNDGTTLYGPLAGVASQTIAAVGDEFIQTPNPLYEPFGPEYIGGFPNPLYIPGTGPQYLNVPNPAYIAAQFIPGFPSISGITVLPDNAHRYNVFRYFTDLKYGDVNLNTNPSFILGWSSSDLAGIPGHYGADIALVSMYKENGPQQGSTLPVTYNYTVDSTRIISGVPLISTIPSGRYYYIYDFVSATLAAIQARNIEVYYPVPPDNSSIQQTSVFTFITKFLQSITAFPTSIAPGGTITIIPDFGIGYPLNTYQITVNDSTNSTRRSALAPNPFQYTPPLTTNTRTYTITVNGSSDTYDTNTHTAEFIAYQYVANISIVTRILQSARNFISWTGGSVTEQFQYGTTAITTNGSTTFTSGNKVDSGGLTAGVGYQIKPTNVNERNPSGTYSTFYFDSIIPNTILISSTNSLQRYTITWNAYYKFNSPAPDGPRQYPVIFTGNGTTYNGTSNYNVLVIPFSAVTYGVPYTIQVEDIIVATNIYFFDAPTNFAITPNKINFENTVTWVSVGNPVFNVRMGNYVFQSSSPYTYNFTEDIIDPVGDVSFWPLGSSESSAIITDSYNFSANTIFVSLPASIPVFSGVFFSFDIGSVLYRNDTFSLSLYRNGLVVQELEAIVSNPFTWFPYNYAVTYQPGDQLYVKSNEHLNYGVSVPFTFIVNATVALDTIYTIFSTIVATMTIDADVVFTARLRGPVTVPVTFTRQGKQYTIQLNQYSIPLGTYQLDFILVNSPTIIVTSPTFIVTTTVTVDQPEYTIISTVNATLYVGVPTTFTVALQDVDQLFPPIALPSFTANLLSTYSFKLYGLPVTDANYVLQFTSATALTSPVFAVSKSYFSFEELIIPVPPSRATTNTLCVTAKKNNLPTTIISIKNNIVYPTAIRGQPQFLVPCGILPYLKELTELLKTLPLREALLFLIQKYNIPQNTPAITNKKRYQLPTANSKVLNPILQFKSSFRLSSKIPGNSVPISTFFVQKLTDARVLTLCNDDTKTFSATYTDMLKNATYWLSTLAQFTKDGDYTFCVVRPLQGSLKQFITASITLKDNQLIFTPVILRVVLSFYEPYGPVDFSIMFTSPLLTEIVKYLNAQYEKIYINPATAL